jgi:hypothetical protein
MPITKGMSNAGHDAREIVRRTNTKLSDKFNGVNEMNHSLCPSTLPIMADT